MPVARRRSRRRCCAIGGAQKADDAETRRQPARAQRGVARGRKTRRRRRRPHERAPAARRAGRGQRALGDRRWCTRATSIASCSCSSSAWRSARDELNIEFGRLQLEQATWAESNRIDQVARDAAGHEVPGRRRHRGGAAMRPMAIESAARASRCGACAAARRRSARNRAAVQPAQPAAAGRRHARPVLAGAGRPRGRPAGDRQRLLSRSRATRASCARSRSRPRAA